MSVLKAFLNPEPIDKTEKIIISDRFKDDDGNVVPFTIRTISQQTNEELAKKAQRLAPVKGSRGTKTELDNIKYTTSIVVACTVEPNFADAELCRAYGTMDPMDVPSRMLSAGEYARLAKAIMEFNGFDRDAEEVEKEAKNS